MTTNNNRYLKIILPTAFCALVVVIMLIVLSSCNAEKRTTRKAERKLDKSVRLDPMVAARYCATRYSPIDSINERIIYKAGKTIYDTVLTTEIEIINDTVYLNKVKTVTVTKHDTLDRVKYVQVENKAGIELFSKENATLKEKITSLKTSLSYFIWATVILGAYTLLRWVLRAWKIKLP